MTQKITMQIQIWKSTWIVKNHVIFTYIVTKILQHKSDSLGQGPLGRVDMSVMF